MTSFFTRDCTLWLIYDFHFCRHRCLCTRLLSLNSASWKKKKWKNVSSCFASNTKWKCSPCCNDAENMLGKVGEVSGETTHTVQVTALTELGGLKSLQISVFLKFGDWQITLLNHTILSEACLSNIRWKCCPRLLLEWSWADKRENR